MAPRANIGSIILLPFVALLGWLSANSTVAAFLTLPHQSVVASAEALAPAEVGSLRAAAAAHVKAAKWFDGPRHRLQAARSLLALPTPLRMREDENIERLTRSSLAGAPMSAYGWTLLAFLRERDQDLPGAVRAWEMSVLVGRYVPALMQSRLLLGINMLRYDRTIYPSVVEQMRTLAEADPSSLARAARKGGIEAAVRGILVDRDQAAAFERETRVIVAGASRRLEKQAEARR